MESIARTTARRLRPRPLTNLHRTPRAQQDFWVSDNASQLPSSSSYISILTFGNALAATTMPSALEKCGAHPCDSPRSSPKASRTSSNTLSSRAAELVLRELSTLFQRFSPPASACKTTHLNSYTAHDHRERKTHVHTCAHFYQPVHLLQILPKHADWVLRNARAFAYLRSVL